MIHVYKKTLRDARIQSLDLERAGKGAWVHLDNPTEEEVDSVVKQFELDRGHLTDALDPHETPRFEMEKSGSYIFLRFPYFEAKDTIATAPVLFVITADMVVTIAKAGGEHIFDDFVQGKVDFATTQRARFLVYAFLKISLLYQQTVGTINKRLRVKRDQILHKITDSDIATFVQWEDTLNDFITALVPASNIYKTMLSRQNIEIFEEDSDLIEDLLLSNDEAIDVCKTNIRTITNIREAYSAIVANNLNRTMKFLAAITIVLAVPTLIASIYGMNVALPLQDAPHAFTLVMGIVVAFVVAVLWVFNRKNWL